MIFYSTTFPEKVCSYFQVTRFETWSHVRFANKLLFWTDYFIFALNDSFVNSTDPIQDIVWLQQLTTQQKQTVPWPFSLVASKVAERGGRTWNSPTHPQATTHHNSAVTAWDPTASSNVVCSAIHITWLASLSAVATHLLAMKELNCFMKSDDEKAHR